MRFANDPIEVDVRIGAQGDVHILAFVWRGQRYPVTGMGRTYSRDQERFFLVMTPGDRVFELRWRTADNLWFVARAPGRLELA